MTKYRLTISFKWWSKSRTDWPRMTHTISTGKTFWSKLLLRTEWSTSLPIQKLSTFWGFSRSTERSVRSSRITRKPKKLGANSTNYWEKKPSDKETLFALPKSRSCKTSKQLKRPSSWNSAKLGTTTWVTMKPLPTCLLKNWRRNIWSSSRSFKWKSGTT